MSDALSNGKGRLFEFAVLFHPRPTKDQLERGEHPKSEILVTPTHVVAKDEQEVLLQAARKVDEAYMAKADQLEIAIRPF
jgi:hypothetical protein